MVIRLIRAIIVLRIITVIRILWDIRVIRVIIRVTESSVFMGGFGLLGY